MKKFMRENPEEFAAAMLLAVTTALVLLNVFFRYFLNRGIYWSEEVATSCFVWSVFLGAAGSCRCGAQLGIDLLVKSLPPALRRAAELAAQGILTAINAYILWLSVVYVRKTAGIATSVLGVSSAFVSCALIAGFGLMTIYSLLRLTKLFRRRLRGDRGEREEMR